MRNLKRRLWIKKALNKGQIIVCGVFLTLVAGLALLLIWLPDNGAAGQETNAAQKEIQFSVPAGFYEDEVALYLSADQDGEILYTLDGSVPDRDSGSTRIYSPGEAILLQCTSQEKVYTIRAALLRQDMEETIVNTASYIVGAHARDRYDIPVLVLSGAPGDLLDQETGILSRRNRRIMGRDAERAVQITLFDARGGIMLSQNCGVRVQGGVSRDKNQPSLRFYARSEYDTENRFNCVLYQDYSMENALMADHKRVIARNSGDDNGYAHLRSEFASRLSLNAGFPDAQGSSPLCVYVNGKYYGVYWFVPDYDGSYFEQKYGDYAGEMVVMEGVVSYMEPAEDDDEPTLELKEEYNALHERLAYGDLSVESEWELLNAVIDVENFLRYVAIENYCCNTDAFVNNFKTYRYYSPEDDYKDGTVFDGRYRFLLYDLDETLGFGTYASTDAEARILSTTNRVEYDIFYNALFSNIVSTEEGRNYYVRYYLSLLNYYFNSKQAVPVLEEMHESRAAELRYQYENTDLMERNFETPGKVDYSHVLTEINEIKDFLEDRPDWALADLESAFGLSGRYDIFVQNPGEANISVDFAAFHDTEYTGTYFAEVPVTVSVSPKCGDRFDYWLVNGVEYYDRTLTITGDMPRNNAITLECVTSPDPDAGLLISAVKSRGGNDYVVLTNFGEQTQNLADYILADGADERNGSTLPSLKVAPGEEVTVYCKNYTGVEAIGKPEVGFNIKAGETLHLYKDGLIQKVSVPRLGTRDGVYRMDVHDGEFYENLK